MKYLPYPAYKDSGIPWLGKIPEHWQVKRAKFIIKVIMGQSPPSDSYIFDGNGLPFLQGNAEFGQLNPSPKIYCEISRKIVKKNDILISVRAPVGALNVADQNYGIGRGLCGLRPSGKFLNRSYMWYSLHHVKIQLNLNSTGSTYDAVSTDDISNLIFMIPNLEEQKEIANFLDGETGKIDALVEKKERQIELLQEKRSALISRAVTRGLDPHVPLKDAGIPWLGKIPEHWQVMHFKYILKEPLKYGANEIAELDDPLLPRYIRITDINDNGTLKKGSEKYLSEEIAKNYILENDDLLFARSGATVGKSFLYKSKLGRAAFAGYLIRARINTEIVNPNYVFYFCFSRSYWNWLSSNFIQATIQNVSAEKYANLILPIPNYNEQITIIDFLDGETGKIDALVEKIKKSIELLKERRAALISAAVTGKIRVYS